jgi:TolB-like protein/DNA-binding winged helix-turn-helix (wHTH) protein
VNSELLHGFYLGELLVDPVKGLVTGHAGATHVPPKAMEVLLVLASNPGTLVSRRILLEEVWGKGRGSQEALSHAVSEIRHALDDHADDPEYIQTLPKRGYRLISEVLPTNAHDTSVVMAAQLRATNIGLLENIKQRGVLETAFAYLLLGWLLIQVADIVFNQLLLPAWAGTFVTVLVIAGLPIAIILAWFLEFRDGRGVLHELSPHASVRRRLTRTYIAVIGALGIATVIVFVYDQSVGLPQAEITRTQTIAEQADLPPVLDNSIAVLPFLNLDGSDNTQVFSNGLADDVITRLVRVPGLLVSSRGDAFTLAPNTGSAQVRERLRVALYLEGSVEIIGEEMRVIIQMIDSETGFHVLSKSFDRALADYFDMRDEITELIVANVRVALPPETQALATMEHEESGLDAYILYRTGKETYERPRTLASLAESVTYYNQALELDVQYTAAHAGLCDAYVARFELSSASDDIRRAESACAAALSTTLPTTLPAGMTITSYSRMVIASIHAYQFSARFALHERGAEKRRWSPDT